MLTLQTKHNFSTAKFVLKIIKHVASMTNNAPKNIELKCYIPVLEAGWDIILFYSEEGPIQSSIGLLQLSSLPYQKKENNCKARSKIQHGPEPI